MHIKNICNIYLGKSIYNHKYFNENIGNYSVYSSQTSNYGEIAKINTCEFVNKTGITWTKDGIHAGTVFKRINDSFSLTTHCGFIEIKNEFKNQLLLEFIFFYLVFNLKKIAIGEQNKRITEKMLGNYVIPYIGDIPKQESYIQQMSKAYNAIESSKKFIAELDNLNLNNIIKTKLPIKNYQLSEIIDIGQTNSSFLTQKFVNDNTGDIPVYGASEFDNPSYGMIISNAMYVKDNSKSINVKYFNNCFTWNIDGSLGVFYRKGLFSLSEKVIPFYLKKELLEKIIPEYLVIQILDIAKKQGFTRQNKFGGDKLLKLSIPLFDLDMLSINEQESFLLKYNNVKLLKSNIVKSLENIS